MDEARSEPAAPSPVSRRRSRAATWGIHGALLLFACLFFHQALFENRVFYVWDLGLGYLPVQVDNARLRADGEIPLWNRHLALGYPITAETEQSGIYPPSLVFNLIDSPARAFVVFILSHYLLALFGSVYLARASGVGRIGQTVAAIVFVFGGAFVAQTVNLPLITTMAWTPWIVGLQLRAQARRSWGLVVLAGVALGCQTLGAHFQISFYTGLLVLLVGALTGRGRLRFTALATLAIFGLGLSLSASQILYTLDLMQYTERATRLPYDVLVSFSLPPHYLLQLVTPDLFGGERYWVGGDNVYELRVYLGLLTLGLVALGWKTVGRLATLYRVVLIAGVVLALGRFTGLFHLLGLLPGFGSMRAPVRFFLFASLAAAMLAGMGVDRILESRPGAVRTLRRLAFAYLAVAGLVAAAAVLVVGWVPLEIFARQLTRVANLGLDADYARAVLAGLDPDAMALLRAAVVRSLVATTILALIAAGAWLWYVRMPSARMARIVAWSTLAVIGLDLLAANGSFHRFADDALYTASRPEIDFLQQQPGLWRARSYLPHDELDPDPADLIGSSGALYGIDTTDALWSTPFRDVEWYFGPGSGGLNLKELALFNVRYVLRFGPSGDPGLELRFRDGNRYVYEILEVQPRVAVCESWEIVADLEETKQRIRGEGFRLGQSVVLNEEPSFTPGEDPIDEPRTHEVEVAEYGPHRMHLSASLARPGILVVSDLYHRGWRATTNGREIDILRANALVRGIALGPGRHEVVLDYRPTGFWVGLYWGAAVLVLLVVAFAGAALIRRRRVVVSSAAHAD